MRHKIAFSSYLGIFPEFSFPDLFLRCPFFVVVCEISFIELEFRNKRPVISCDLKTKEWHSPSLRVSSENKMTGVAATAALFPLPPVGRGGGLRPARPVCWWRRRVEQEGSGGGAAVFGVFFLTAVTNIAVAVVFNSFSDLVMRPRHSSFLG